MTSRKAARLSLFVSLLVTGLIYAGGGEDGRRWHEHAAMLFMIAVPLWGAVYNLIAARHPGRVRAIELAAGGDGPPSDPIMGSRASTAVMLVFALGLAAIYLSGWTGYVHDFD